MVFGALKGDGTQFLLDNRVTRTCIRIVVVRTENGIHPNGDQQNDFFVIPNIEFWGNELTIYGRWGNKVYEAKNYVNQWKADDLPDGTYYYVLKLNRDGREMTGHITVLR